MPEFFLELFSEEIPARMQREAGVQLEKICSAALAGLQIQVVEVFTGPRRIALKAIVNEVTEAREIEERGPRESAPEAALAGFLGKHKAQRADVVAEGGYFLLRRREAAVKARDLIFSALPGALAKFAWPKSMRWGQSGEFTWVRPLRRVVCLLDGEVLPIVVGPVMASDVTEGHRFMSSGEIQVFSAQDWEQKLKDHYVIADAVERETMIAQAIPSLCIPLDLAVAAEDVHYADQLISEVSGLVEWPVALIGKIDENFMDLPPEVRELSMKVNQRYFALRDSGGNPAPYFAFISNIDAPDGNKAIIAGNERVLRARLSDARHFWDQDLKTPLNELLPKLDKITFHAKIGTQGQRVERISMLARQISEALGLDGYATKQAEWAGKLCKADLVSGMVGEFPELQGVMGGYYAATNANGWDGRIVGPAIKTHYQPRGPSDAVPKGKIAASVALADKLDTLIEFFRIDERPTGSGDPYALRRAALGVIRIILENNLSLPLYRFLDGDGELFNFIIDRLRFKLKSEGQRPDILDAVLAIRRNDDLLNIMNRVDAVTSIVNSDVGKNVLIGYRRAINILKIEDAIDGPHMIESISPNFKTKEEESLQNALQSISSDAVGSFNHGNYGPFLDYLSDLRRPIDAFFEQVTINSSDSDLRRSRLGQLALLRHRMHLIADFSKIEG